MRLKALLVACLVLATSVGHTYECADAETSAVSADLTSKLARVSSFYLEITRNW